MALSKPNLRRRHAPRLLACLLGLGCAALTPAACSSPSADRAPFAGETSPTTPREDEPPPQKPSQTGPSSPTGDASAPDADDGCQRTPPSNACGIVPQCGCGASETCDVGDDKGTAVCVAAGKAAMGQSCTSTSGCAKGLSCVFGTCHAFCNNPGSACTAPSTGGCLQVTAGDGSGGSVAVPNLAVCMVKCDPVNPASCGATTAAGTAVCMVDDKGTTDCQQGGNEPANAACGGATGKDCGPALVCTVMGDAGAGSCKRWCRVGQADCGGSTECRGFSTKIVVDGVELGACP